MEQASTRESHRSTKSLSTEPPTRPAKLESDGQAFARWCAAMKEGDFAHAWRINHERGRHWPSAHTLWRGQSLEHAAVRLRAMHGLGDAVQMMRYAGLIGEMARSVEYDLPPRLIPLLPYFAGVPSTSVSCHGEHRGSSRTIDVEMMELPYLFQITPGDLPLRSDYLSIPAHSSQWLEPSFRPASYPRVGVVWAGGEWDADRWLPIDLLRPVMERSQGEFWNLQGGPFATQGRELGLRSIPDHSDGSGGPGDSVLRLAAIISKLDLVLTIDTLAAHLGGAQGVPTWVMLKHDADWRWMQGRADSPWYPSVRLFRQESPGDWRGVMAQVQAALTTERL